MRGLLMGAVTGVALLVSLAALGTVWAVYRGEQSAVSIVPSIVAYQGVLADTKGVPVPNEEYKIIFRLYAVLSEGDVVWEEVRAVSTVNGVFNGLLGQEVPLDGVFASSPLYLGVQVDGESEMIPRQPIASVPFALQARNADTLDGLDSSAFAPAGGTVDDLSHIAQISWGHSGMTSVADLGASPSIV